MLAHPHHDDPGRGRAPMVGEVHERLLEERDSNAMAVQFKEGKISSSGCRKSSERTAGFVTHDGNERRCCRNSFATVD